MSSFEEKYILHNPTIRERLKRNYSLLVESCMFFLTWLTLGRRIRKALQQAREENRKIKLEQYLGN